MKCLHYGRKNLVKLDAGRASSFQKKSETIFLKSQLNVRKKNVRNVDALQQTEKDTLDRVEEKTSETDGRKAEISKL